MCARRYRRRRLTKFERSFLQMTRASRGGMTASVDELARSLGCVPQTVCNCRSRLVSWGLISCEHGGGAMPGAHLANAYEITSLGLEALSQNGGDDLRGLMRDHTKQRANIVLFSDQVAELERRSIELGISRSALVRRVLDAYFDKPTKEGAS